MLNPINEMRRLSSRSYDDLLRVATTNYGFCPNGARGVSKVELITYIVTVTAIRDQFADMIAHPQEEKSDRTRFIIDNDGDTHHVMLTKEQIDFMDWCFNKNIDFSCAGAEKIKDVDWETP